MSRRIDRRLGSPLTQPYHRHGDSRHEGSWSNARLALRCSRPDRRFVFRRRWSSTMSCRCACTHSGKARARVPLPPARRFRLSVCCTSLCARGGSSFRSTTSTHQYSRVPLLYRSLRGRQEFVCSRPSYVFPEYLMQYQCVSDSIPPLQLCCDALPPAALRILMRDRPPRKSDRSAPLRLAPLCFAFRTVSHDCIVAFRTVQYFCADGHFRYLRPSRSGVFGASPTVSGMAQQDSTKAAVRRPSAASALGL